MPNGIKKIDLPSKICVICMRPFTWRKKWEKCWDQVLTCSKSCKRKRKDGNMAKAEPTDGRKDCTLCHKSKDLLIRCKVDASGTWHMVCGKCWKDVSGGVPDGDLDHPYYFYGGLWKNRR